MRKQRIKIGLIYIKIQQNNTPVVIISISSMIVNTTFVIVRTILKTIQCRFII